MTPEAKRQLNTESDRGAQADAILANPLFQDAFMAINRSVWHELTKVNVHDDEAVTALLLMLKANQRLYKHFESLIRTGRMADIQLRTENARGSIR